MPQLISVLLISMILSPIWPLGENPLPGDPFIIVNKMNNEMALINENKVQTIVNVSTGKTDSLTPEGLFTIIVKARYPYYRKKNIPGGDDKNPLGTRWIGFDAENSDGRIYGLHGTNDPSSIGKKISQGCIRLQNEAIEALYEYIPIGTRILVINSSKDFREIGIEYGAIEKEDGRHLNRNKESKDKHDGVQRR